MPLHLSGPCVEQEESGCRRREGFFFRDSQRFYVATYTCPDADSPKEGCALIGETGDPAVQREMFESVLGIDRTELLYLAEPAAAGSYTAWSHAATGPLDSGYHLFSRAAPPDLTDARVKCVEQASMRGVDEAAEQLDLQSDTPPSAAVQATFRETNRRLSARYAMKSCAQPDVQELGTDQPLTIEIDRDPQRPFTPTSP